MVFLIILMLGYGLCETITHRDFNFDRDLIQRLIERIDSLEAKDYYQDNQIQQLLLRDREQHREIERLLTLEREQQAHIAQLIKENQQQQAEIERLQGVKQDHGNPTENSSLIKQKTAISKEIDKTSSVPPHTQRITARQFPTEIPVAFFARLTHHLDHEGADQNLVFDSVVTNIGNGYNNHHGVFTAPVSGVYVFSSTILAKNEHKVCANFVVNGNMLSRMCSYAIGGDFDSGSGTIVVQMNKGDDFAMQNGSGDGYYYGGNYDFISGFLLYGI